MRAGVYAIFLLLGTGTLLPFNVFITERDFFEVRSIIQPTWISAARNMENIIVTTFQVCNFTGLLAIVYIAANLSLRVLVLWPMLVNTLVLAVMHALASASHTSGRLLLATVLPSAAITGGSAACVQAGTFALAACFPPLYMQALLAGQAVAGLAVSLTAFITLWVAPPFSGVPSPQHVSAPAATYFLSATVVTAACAAAYLALWQIPFAVHCWETDDARQRCSQLPKPTEDETQYHQDPLPLSSSAADTNVHQSSMVTEPSALSTCRSPPISHDVEGAALLQPPDLQSPTFQSIAACDPADNKQWTSWDIAVHLKEYISAVTLTFIITLAVFPGIATAICSSQSSTEGTVCTPSPSAGRLNGELFVPVLFVLYNLGDITGRLSSCIGPWGRSPPSGSILLAYAVLRLPLAAALAFCRVIMPRHWLPPMLFRSDVWPLLFTFLLGTSNGHLASLICMHAPSLLPVNAKGGCGAVLAFAITTGVTIGSVIALLLTLLLQSQ